MIIVLTTESNQTLSFSFVTGTSLVVSKSEDNLARRHFKYQIFVDDHRCIGMGTIPIPSIDTVDTCELAVSIDTSTKYR